jgi:hypothetical protein
MNNIVCILVACFLSGGVAFSAILAGFDFDADASDLSEVTVVATRMTASQLSAPMNIALVTTSGGNSGVDAEGEVFKSRGRWFLISINHIKGGEV